MPVPEREAPASLHAELTYGVPASVAPYLSTPSVMPSAIPASVAPYLSTPSVVPFVDPAITGDSGRGLVLDRGAAVQFRAAPAKLGTDSVVLMEIERHMWPSTSEDIKRTRGEHAEASCAICLEDMQAASCVRLSCGHCMHTACAQASERHGLVDKGIYRCPECRGAVSCLRAVFCAHSIELLRIPAAASSNAEPQNPVNSDAVLRGDMTDVQSEMLLAEIRRTLQQSSEVAGGGEGGSVSSASGRETEQHGGGESLPPVGEQERRLQHGLQHGLQRQAQDVQLRPGHVASLDAQDANVVMLDAVDLEHHLAAISCIDSSVSVVISTSPRPPRAVEGNQTAEHHGLRGEVSQPFPSGSPGLAPSLPGVAGAPPPPGTRADVGHPPILQAGLQDAPTLIQDRNVVMSMYGIDPSSSSAPGGVLQAGGLQDAHTLIQARWYLLFIFVSITKLVLLLLTKNNACLVQEHWLQHGQQRVHMLTNDYYY